MSANEREQDADKEKAWVLFFVLVLLVCVGLPVWWHTTTVYRAQLPLSEMAASTAPELVYPLEVDVIFGTDRGGPGCKVDKNSLEGQLNREMEGLAWGHAINGQTGHSQRNASQKFIKTTFKVTVREVDVSSLTGGKSLEGLTPSDIDIAMQHSDRPGHYRIIVLPGASPSGVAAELEPYMGSFRTAIFQNVACGRGSYPASLTSSLVKTVARVADAAGSEAEVSHRAQAAFPPSGRYHLALTLLVADPLVANVDWPVAESVHDKLGPVLKELGAVAKITVDSQILYHAGISSDLVRVLSGRKDEQEKGFYLTSADLRLFVNPSDWNVATTGDTPTLSFLLFVPDHKTSPMHIRLDDGSRAMADAFVLPRWGGVVILNPQYDQPPNDSGRKQLVIGSQALEAVMDVFVSQLRTLLGVPANAHTPSTQLMSQWEHDVVLRYRTAELVDRASSALASLARLLGSIENMVIQDHLQMRVLNSLTYIKKAQAEASAGRLVEAHAAAQSAFDESEAAFFDPSMLALLYFPDEHKFAIYLPLFLPVLFPVLIATLKTAKAVLGRRKEEGAKVKTE